MIRSKGYPTMMHFYVLYKLSSQLQQLAAFSLLSIRPPDLNATLLLPLLMQESWRRSLGLQRNTPIELHTRPIPHQLPEPSLNRHCPELRGDDAAA